MRGPIVSGGITAALIAGLVAIAPAAAADTGDVTPFSLPAGAGTVTVISGTSKGDLWLGGNSPALVRLTTDGVASLVPVAGLPANASMHGIAEDANGRVWFTEYETDSLWSVNSNGGDPKRLQLPNAKSVPWGLTRGPDGNLWFAEVRNRVGRLTPAGAISEFDVPAGMTPFQVTSAPDGRILATGTAAAGTAPNTVYTALVTTVTPAGAVSTAGPAGTAAIDSTVGVTSDGKVWLPAKGRTGLVQTDLAGTLTGKSVSLGTTEVADITVGPDDSVWFTSTKPTAVVGRIAPGSKQASIVKLSAGPTALTFGPDGNVWVTTSGKPVYRVLSGITPASTTSPTASSPAGSTNGTGTVLSVTNGSWAFQPTTFAQQWQRCTSSDPATCADIAGANKPTYTVTDVDLGAFVRANISATNLNGVGKSAGSNLLPLAPKPVVPVQPTAPTPVAGGATLTIAPGVTARVSGPSTAKRKAKKPYRITFSTPQPRGSVRISLINADGAEAYVITSGIAVKGAKKTAYAAKVARVPRSVPKGRYTLRAVYAPATTQAATYAVATLTKPIRLT